MKWPDIPPVITKGSYPSPPSSVASVSTAYSEYCAGEKREQNILTVGVEIEFIYPGVSWTYDDTHHPLTVVKTALESEFLISHEHPHKRYILLDGNLSTRPEIATDQCPYITDEDLTNQRHFLVKWEPSCSMEGPWISKCDTDWAFTKDDNKWGCYIGQKSNEVLRNLRGVEVVTPILREASVQRTIPKMLNAIRGLDIRFNASTGLHVHVGRRGGWTYSQLIKIAKAVVIFEEAMDKKHPPCRLANDTYFKSNIELLGIKGRKRTYRVKFIESSVELLKWKSGESVLSWLVLAFQGGDDRGVKYNFRSVRKHGTVEFRQGVAAVDEAYVMGWTETVLNFVTAAINTERKGFEYLAEGEDVLGDTLEAFLKDGKELRDKGGVGDFWDLWVVDLEDEIDIV